MIDLKEVFIKYPRSFETHAKLISLLRDLFPQKRKEINLIINAYDLDIPNRLKSSQELDSILLNSLIKSMYDEYGLEKKACEDSILCWAKLYGLTIAENEESENKSISESTEDYQLDSLKYTEKNKQKNSYNMPHESEHEKSDDILDFEYVILDDNHISIKKYIGAKTGTIVVPAKLKERYVVCIEESAFEGIKNIDQIILPNGIKSIERRAFADSTIIEIVLPNTVNRIGELAFSGCKYLKHIQLSRNLNILPTKLFWWCTSLENITIPENVVKIFDNAFNNCFALRIIELNKSLISLDSLAFYGCKSLQSILLPKSLQSIGEHILGNEQEHITVMCYNNSAAYVYAKKMRYRVQTVEDNTDA